MKLKTVADFSKPSKGYLKISENPEILIDRRFSFVIEDTTEIEKITDYQGCEIISYCGGRKIKITKAKKK